MRSILPERLRHLATCLLKGQPKWAAHQAVPDSCFGGLLVEPSCLRGFTQALATGESGTRSGLTPWAGLAARFESASCSTALSTTLVNTHRQHYSSSSAKFAEGDTVAPSDAAELNPLLQTPTPAGTSGDAPAGVPSYYGPGKAVAKLRGIAMSPKKMNHFAAVIRRKHVDDALTQCRLSPKKAAKITAGVIISARANAETNHGLDPSRLAVDIVNVGKGTHLKRTSYHAKGRFGVRLRYRCHLEVVLKESNLQPRMRYMTPLLERPRRHSGHRQLPRKGTEAQPREQLDA